MITRANAVTNKIKQRDRQGAGAKVARHFAWRRKQEMGETFRGEQIGYDDDE